MLNNARNSFNLQKKCGKMLVQPNNAKKNASIYIIGKGLLGSSKTEVSRRV